MKNLLLLLLATFALSFSACQKAPPPDPCANVTCLNGGYCEDGTCTCLPNYSGIECQTYTPPDPCANVTCFNGGTCINGSCDCPPGYAGPNCQTILNPTSITITRIELLKYPLTKPDGSNWDNPTGGNLPDVYVTFNLGSSPNTSEYVSGYYSDVTGGPLTYTTNLPQTILYPNSTYTFGVWDKDLSQDDEMYDNGSFIPNDYSSGFPATISLVSGDGAYEWDFHVDWNF